jgi:hypothetical protein
MQIDVVVPVVVSVYFKRALVRRKRQPLTAELRRRCARGRERRGGAGCGGARLLLLYCQEGYGKGRDRTVELWRWRSP